MSRKLYSSEPDGDTVGKSFCYQVWATHPNSKPDHVLLQIYRNDKVRVSL